MIENRIRKLDKHLNSQKAKLHTTYNRRLFSGLLTAGALVAAAFLPENVYWNALGFLIGPGFFIYFVISSQKVKAFHERLQELLEFFKRQERRKNGHTPAAITPLEPIPSSAHGGDLDLFTENGLFHLIDETVTPGGREKLLNELLHPQHQREKILQRQETIKALSQHSWFLTRFLIEGHLCRRFQGHSEQLLDFIQRPFLEKAFFRDYKILTGLFLLSLLGLANGLFFKWFPEISPFFFLSLHFIYSLIAASSLGGVFQRAHDMALQLSSLMPLMKTLEKKIDHPDFAEHLRGLRSFSPGRRMRWLNGIISCLSVQGHPLVFMTVNGLLPWSFFFASQLEKQRLAMESSLPQALKDLYDFEVLTSLCMIYKHQTQTFPEVSEKPELKFEEAFHPLIDRQQVVANSFDLGGDTHLNLVTGSNMSGKSSFLRTIGVNHILLLLGAPVFAKSYSSYPFELTTCIRVTDALDSGISYFYAEVLRLKEIMLRTEKEQPVLYLIDEIFKGTNNRERLIGSRSVLEKLAESSSVGFVTTHDLELTQLADEFPLVKNWHFRDDVKDGEMTFNYQLQSGPCPTTNALKIMKSAGLPVPAN